MTFSVEELELLDNGSIYYEECGTLANRIDFSWSVYSATGHYDNYKIKALKFLIYAFDLSDTEDINQQLIVLMSERQKYKNLNPDYIPSKQSKHIPLDPSSLDLRMVTSDVPDAIQQAIQAKELLDLKDMHKYTIDPKHTRYLDATERAYFRVHIRNGLFEQDGGPFDTSSMESHGRIGYAAYTINANGEISVFTHNSGADGLYHSSMNAGAPVISAGELKIQNGRLLEITTHSGHYNPTLFNVYRTLEYFSSHNVDISAVQIRTQSNPVKAIKNATPVSMNPGYLTPATQIYKGINKLLTEAIQEIASDLQRFKDDPLTTLFGFYISQLTNERMRLAEAFKNEIEVFKESLTYCSPKQIFDIKIPELTSMINKYKDKNDELSRIHRASYSRERLTRTIDDFKKRIHELSDDAELKTPKMAPLAIKMKNVY